MDPVFPVTAVVAVASASIMVTRRNPVYAAAWLLVCFLAIAVAFLSLSAAFLAAIHVLVYTGAIMVLFLFVIMLLNLRDDELGDEHPAGVKAGYAALCAGLLALTVAPVLSDPSLDVAIGSPPAGHGSVETVGMVLFRDYGLAFELISLLILVAMFGAVVLAKKKLPA